MAITATQEGLKASEWKRVRMTMFTTGECDPNLLDSMSREQRYFINEVKKTFRDFNREERPVRR